MKDFESFYSTNIEPILPDLSRQNKTADIWGIVMVLAIFAAVLSFILNLFLDEYSNGAVFTLLLFMFSIYSVYAYAKKDDSFSDNFKKMVIGEIIDYLHPGLTYEPNKSVASKEYKQSGLFRRRFVYYDGDDYLGGMYKSVRFHCSEIWTGYTGNQIRRAGNRYTIFKGLFFVARVNEKFKGGTYLWIKGEEQLGTSIADEHFRLFNFPRTAHVVLGHGVFDSLYSVYSTNPAEARTILDEEMMNDLVLFRKQVQRKVVFSVVMGRCYVAIPVKENLFEPAAPLGDKEEIKKYFFSVLLILSVINQLKLAKLN